MRDKKSNTKLAGGYAKVYDGAERGTEARTAAAERVLLLSPSDILTRSLYNTPVQFFLHPPWVPMSVVDTSTGDHDIEPPKLVGGDTQRYTSAMWIMPFEWRERH